MGEFVGKRVVPDHVGVWDQKKTYEPLMIVLDGETGDSYISRKAVPVGVSLADESYWSLCAHYSAQMRKLEQDVDVDVQQMFAIQACGMDAEGANRVPKKNQDDRYEIKSKNLVRLLYQSCGWDRTRSYRLPGVEYPQQRLVNYDLCRAIPIFEGKVDKENESAQEPVQATSGAENI